jgi:lactoylglutathione lyase
LGYHGALPFWPDSLESEPPVSSTVPSTLPSYPPLGAGSSTRPFRVLGIQQVAVGGASKQALRHLWIDMLGLAEGGSFRSEKENVDEDIALLGHGAWQVEVDLMEPIDPSRSPRVDQPALNHVGLWVDDLAAAVDWLARQGMRFAPGGIRKGAAGHDVVFLHPKGNEQFPLSGAGVLIELVQAPAEVIAALGR